MPQHGLPLPPNARAAVRHWSTNDQDLTLTLLTEDPSGNIRPIAHAFASDTQLTTQTDIFPIAGVRLLSAWLAPNSSGNQHGTSYAVLEIGTGDSTANFTPYATLIADYISGPLGATWPAAQFNDNRAGPGTITTSTGGAAAAGNEATFTVNTRHYHLIEAITVRLVTDATSATREVNIRIEDEAGDVIYRSGNDQTQTASLTRDYVFAPAAAGPVTTAGGVIHVPIPPLHLRADNLITTDTNNLQAGDDYTNIGLRSIRHINVSDQVIAPS